MREVGYLPVGGGGQPDEGVTQVSIWIETATAAALDYGVQDGSTLPGFSLSDKQPILLTESRGTDGVLHQVLVNFDASIIEVNTEQRPQVERVVDSQNHAAAGQVPSLYFQAGQDAMKSPIIVPACLSLVVASSYGLLIGLGVIISLPTFTRPLCSKCGCSSSEHFRSLCQSLWIRDAGNRHHPIHLLASL